MLSEQDILGALMKWRTRISAPTEAERARLGAEPLLWPISEHPVLLHSDSKLLVRGRYLIFCLMGVV